MKVAVLKETFPGERRVALVPAAIASLMKSGLEVVVEAGAGAAAGFPDDAYRAAGVDHPGVMPLPWGPDRRQTVRDTLAAVAGH